MAKDTYWFSHDYNARNDNKIKKLIAKHGFAGYGLFWAIIEELYNNDNVLSTDYDLILSDRKAKPEIIKSIVEDFELFVVDGDHFGSTSVEKRLNERNSKSRKASESANLRWNKAKQDANAMRTHTSRNAIKDSIGKDIKEKKRKEKKGNIDSSDFVKSVHPCYSPCIKIYDDWLKQKTGVGMKMNGREGKAMNTIINFISSQEKVAADPKIIIESWQFILSNFHKLTPFHQNRIKLSDIDTDLQNIINQLKNGTAKHSTESDPTRSFAGLKDSISEYLSGTGS